MIVYPVVDFYSGVYGVEEAVEEIVQICPVHSKHRLEKADEKYCFQAIMLRHHTEKKGKATLKDPD